MVEATTSDQLWGKGDDLTKMLQIGGTGFESGADYEEVRRTKIAEAAQLVPKFEPRAHEVGLEIGSGLGVHTAYIANLCKHVHTVDVSDHFKGLFERYTAGADNITRHRREFFPMLSGIEDDSIDFAWSVAVFCHMHNYDIYHYFMELSRKIKKGGRFHVNWQSADTIQYGQDWFVDIAAQFMERGQFVPIWQTCVQFHSNEFYYRTADYFGFDATRKWSNGAYTEALFVKR